MKFNIINKIKSAFQHFKKSNEINTQKLNDFQLMCLHKKMKKKESVNNNPGSNIAGKIQSMSDSQGKSDFSGSSYNGPGNVDREKVHSSAAQKNFES